MRGYEWEQYLHLYMMRFVFAFVLETIKYSVWKTQVGKDSKTSLRAAYSYMAPELQMKYGNLGDSVFSSIVSHDKSSAKYGL